MPWLSGDGSGARHRHSFRARGAPVAGAGPIPFNVSIFPVIQGRDKKTGLPKTSSVFSKRPILKVGLSWEELTSGKHIPTIDKEQIQMFSPVEFVEGHGVDRNEQSKFVVGVHFAVFDFDDLHESLWPQAFGGLERSGVAHVTLSTWSHTGRRKKEPSYYKDRSGVLIPPLPGTYYQLRVLIPFSRMALASEWPRVWDTINERLLGGLGDPACKSVVNRYFGPSYPEGAGVPPIHLSSPGGAVDVDGLLASLGPPPKEAAPSVVGATNPSITRYDLGRIARALRNSSKKRELGDALSLIAKGDVYAPSGQRHSLTYKIVREILDRHPAADHEALADLFMPSLTLMQPTHITRDVVLGFCTHKEPNAVRVDHTSRIAEAFGGARAEAYVQEDILEMAESLSARPDEIGRRWIIQKGSSYYVLCDGKYRCYGESDVGNAVLRDLAPAASVGIDLYEMTQRGMRRKKIAELMEQYGSVAVDVEVDLAAQCARYDSVAQIFIEAPCPIRVTAKYDAGVEQWLRLLAGPKEDVLLDWIASITKLDEPCAALYLEGMGGTGKSFLAYALARIFTADGSPTPLREAMADFNELMTSCPVILADETIPTNSRGQMMTAEIREFVQARARPLRRKYKPAATLKGALRLILAANNRGLLSAGNENLTEFDVAALGERFVHIVVQPEARAFIESQDTVRWMAEDRVARHAMWLVENWEVKRTGRFIVAGQSQELVAALSTQTGLRALVCQWVAGFLLSPSRVVNQYGRDKLVAVDQGRLLVTARVIHEAWTIYLQDKGTPPTPTMIARALGGLSKAVSIRDGIIVRRYREFSLESLANWGEATGYLDSQVIADALVAIERDQTRGANVLTGKAN